MITAYKTIGKRGTSLYKVKGSKHFGYAANAADEAEVEHVLADIRKDHHAARHLCYAYRLGPEADRFRANDDGEPSNSAGMPILGQIEKNGLTNTVVGVVRYFGGTKLGVGGLIDAYRTAAAGALADAEIIRMQLKARFVLRFEYQMMSDVMLLIRTHNWQVTERDLRQSCKLTLSLPPEKTEEMHRAFAAFPDIRVEPSGTAYEL